MKAIIFDLDGVLIDACEWHFKALNRALIKSGNHAISRKDHINKYNGLPTRDKLKMMGIYDPIVSELKKKYTAELIVKNCKPDKEKIKMVEELCQDYILAVCSNAIQSSVVDMLKRANIYQYFELIMGNDEIENPKPNPEIYLKAFEKLRLKPKDCLIVEDAPHGIEAAKMSGALTIAVRGYKDVNIDLFRRISCFK
jgi:HAD superfamily hydrolase (TIGR01509 family)